MNWQDFLFGGATALALEMVALFAFYVYQSREQAKHRQLVRDLMQSGAVVSVLGQDDDDDERYH